MINDIFRTDPNLWSKHDKDEVQLFLQNNIFFSEIYQHGNFEQVIKMIYYAKTTIQRPFQLQSHKKPKAIIQLSGKIQVQSKKKSTIKRNNKNSKSKTNISSTDNPAYQIFYENQQFLCRHLETYIAQTSLELRLISVETQAQFLYIPQQLYHRHIKDINEKKYMQIQKSLKSYFKDIQRKPLQRLSRSGCFHKQFKINDFVYKSGQEPQYAYILLEGNIIITSSTYNNQIIAGSITLFGEKQLLLHKRQESSKVNSAKCNLLVIPKKPFLKFCKDYYPQVQFRQQKDVKSKFELPLIKKKSSTHQFDLIDKKKRLQLYRSIGKMKTQKFVQDKLAKNCHILLNLSPKGSKTARFQHERNPEQIRDYTKDQFSQKFKLFKKIRPDARKLGLDNQIVDVSPTKKYKLNLSLRQK